MHVTPGTVLAGGVRPARASRASHDVACTGLHLDFTDAWHDFEAGFQVETAGARLRIRQLLPGKFKFTSQSSVSRRALNTHEGDKGVAL
jgi:hypothetical protein